MKKFDLRLKEVRKKRNINQSDLAEKINSNQRVISQYENGIATPSLDRLVELAQILDVSLDELVEFKKIHQKISEEDSKK